MEEGRLVRMVKVDQDVLDELELRKREIREYKDSDVEGS